MSGTCPTSVGRQGAGKYYFGKTGVKYGIWNCSTKAWQFGISEDTPMLAIARLHQKIGEDARKWRFEPRELPQKMAMP